MIREIPSRFFERIWNKPFLGVCQGAPYYALFHTARHTVMRRSELLALRWCEIGFGFCQLCVSWSLHHLKNGSYVFTKRKSSKSKRTILLSSFNIINLNEHRKNRRALCNRLGIPLSVDDLVFNTPDGTPWRPNTITRAWTLIVKNAGIKTISLHDALNNHAWLMLKVEIDSKIVQERLGHSSITYYIGYLESCYALITIISCGALWKITQ